jgi:hypothetical protein
MTHDHHIGLTCIVGWMLLMSYGLTQGRELDPAVLIASSVVQKTKIFL